MTTIYLERASTELVCHCKCERSLVSSPSQLDCPWCGCGWLFTCIDCQKAYAFARGIEVDLTLEELAEKDMRQKWRKPPSAEDIAGWVRGMKILLKTVRPGETYVYLDGWYLPTYMAPLAIDGWHARHRLPALPQWVAVTDPSLLRDTLDSQKYWQKNAFAQREGER